MENHVLHTFPDRSQRSTHYKFKQLDIYKQASYGFTLIEAVISISIIAILLSLAIPSFSPLIDKNRLTTVHNELMTALHLARTVSISTNKDVYLCELINQQQCNSSRPFNADWSQGWLVFIDSNMNGQLDATDDIQLINKREDISNQNQNIAVVFNQRGRLRFRADGTSRSAGFYLCSNDLQKHIYLLHTGRARSNNDLTEKQLQTCLKKLKKTA